MKLDFSSLSKSIAQLELNRKYALTKKDQKTELFLVFRSAVIKAFEYTFEISVKMLKRQLRELESDEDSIEQMTYRDIIRLGAQKGYINQPEEWFEFRKMRNLTAHTYDEAKANQVFLIVPALLEEAKYLLNRLNKSSD